MAKRRRAHGSGLSKGVDFYTAVDDDFVEKETMTGGMADEHWNEAKARLRSMWELISYQRQDLFNSSGHGMSFLDVPIYDSSASDNDDWDDWDDLPSVIPVGEEGAINSNAGGEYSYQSFLEELLKEAPRYVIFGFHSIILLTQFNSDKWICDLVDGYLSYQGSGIPKDDELEGETWEIPCIDFYEYFRQDTRHVKDAQSINESLAYHGLLAEAPSSQPSHSLSVFWRSIGKYIVRRTEEIQRYPNPTLEDQLRVAYDAYLEIQRQVQSRVDAALGRDPTQHFIRNVCKPCLHRLEGETPLDPTMLIAMDGGSSLKMVDSDHRFGRARLDTRQLIHPRWLNAEQVDVFQHEVANARGKPTPAVPPDNSSSSEAPSSAQLDLDSQSDDVPWLEVNEIEGLDECLDTCVERWKAAAPDINKKMYSFFKISGIFLSVCRHGHVLVLCDMRRSGELMKYPLAIVKALLDRYGKELGLGYDIMCAFYKTLLRSEKLRNQVVKFRLRGVVPAFHGHAHNRKCQVRWHPMYIKGVGIEDFEECERTFSESNHLAASTRLATEFHRHQAILEHSDFHDIDKHIASGNFLYQNYRQALERVAADEPLFREFCEKWNVTEDDCERFLEEETEHLSKVYADPPELVVKLDYVELLQKVDKTRRLSDEANTKYRNATRDRKVTAKHLKTLHTKAWTSLEQYRANFEDLLDFETEHNHFRRWKPSDTEYQQTLQAMCARSYRRALERLERLVVQRLLELTKLNMSGLGYKQREKIAQALRARAKAIQHALDDYNNAAAAMDPPRPILEWKSILDMVTIADFDILKDTHLDLSLVSWAQTHHRECMRLHFGLKRAREEILCLNIEIRRLITGMLDDYADLYHARQHTDQQGEYNLALELNRRITESVELNGHITIRLLQASELRGFTGSLIPGNREGRDPAITASMPLAPWAIEVSGLSRPLDAHYQVNKASRDVNEILPLPQRSDYPAAQLLDYVEGMFSS
ncbi:hypothetical protein V5O48_014800 [Marasmius crinis-equi]|uniref:Uncharacterized protein n=1 Tax=Marasmius crinis-equi TaxID=585013 RepID=A0ABR3EWC5_9AGAR